MRRNVNGETAVPLKYTYTYVSNDIVESGVQNGERTIGNKIFFSSLPFASRKRKEKKKKRNISRQCETARLNFLRLPTTLYVIPCLYLCIPLFCAVRTTIYATSIVWGGTPELTCGVLMVSFEGAH